MAGLGACARRVGGFRVAGVGRRGNWPGILSRGRRRGCVRQVQLLDSVALCHKSAARMRATVLGGAKIVAGAENLLICGRVLAAGVVHDGVCRRTQWEAASLDTRLKYIGAPQYIMPAIARRLRAIERRTSTKSWMLGWKRCGYKDLDFQVALISQGCRFGRPSTLDQRTACRQVVLMFSSFVYIKRWSDLRALPCLESLVMLVWTFLMFLVLVSSFS